jgi:fucose 4-O-acetylase-like acetyltransferase
MTNYLSQKLRVLSFISIIAVIFWHGYLSPSETSRFSDFFLFQNLITSAFLRFSIPMFFAISGYLFFFKPFNYRRQIQKRIKTLLLPYLLWSLLGALLVYGLLLFPVTRNILNMQWEFSISHFLKHITIEPLQYQFWFLRDLMVLTVLSPVIYLLSKNFPLVWIVLLGITWMMVGDKGIIIRVESLLFFLIGAVAANGKDKPLIPRIQLKQILWLTGTIWIASSFYFGYCISYHCFPDFIPRNILYAIPKLSGLLFIWFAYDKKQINGFINHHLPAKILSATFFLFCFHEPLLTVFEKISIRIMLQLEWLSYFLYILNPVITIILSFIVYKTLNRFAPRILNILTGNRAN